ncbi:hypothetical protein CERZMDRAFT_30807, partial [Cercospora zeae-maydis SCOH1-5]
PDPSTVPSLSTLRNLPYLSAVIQEGIEVYGHVVPDVSLMIPDSNSALGRSLATPLPYQSARNMAHANLPPGTIFGMSITLQQMNPDIFPEPHEFKPERWLTGGGLAPNGRPLSRYLVAFGKGPRMCLGVGQRG